LEVSSHDKTRHPEEARSAVSKDARTGTPQEYRGTAGAVALRGSREERERLRMTDQVRVPPSPRSALIRAAIVGRSVVVHQRASGGAFEVLVLAGLERPQECAEATPPTS
jgi:hypothetical protein